MTLATAITATAKLDGITEPSEGYGSADYTVTLTVGDREVEVPAWAHCGWLAPGASAGLDGSGLAVWGDSQPGGWTVCDGDGAYTGSARVIPDRDPSPGDPITVGADHLDAVEIMPEMVPEWAAVLAALAATPEDADEWGDREAEAAGVREEIVDAIAAALERVSIDCPEPTADEVWEALGAGAEVNGADCVRVGRWIGCLLVAWLAGDGYEFDWWPTAAPDGAIEAAMTAAERAVDDAVAAAMRQGQDD